MNADLLTTGEAAELTRLSKGTLNRLRVIGGGPKYLKIGPRKVYYRRSDIDAWLAERVYGSTSEYAAA